MARKPNSFGCVPSEDVCLEHCEPLTGRRHCEQGDPAWLRKRIAELETERDAAVARVAELEALLHEARKTAVLATLAQIKLKGGG